MDITGISLFASSGIGDLAVRAAGVDVLVANELLFDRAALFSTNFPETKMIVGDIYAKKDEVISATRLLLDGVELDFLIATPPCQGMSKNGQGKLLSEIRLGRRPTLDPRNRLIIPTMDIAVELRPAIILLENVPEMRDTLIETDDGQLMTILSYISQRLGPDYSGKAEVVEFADYGVPQRRQRLISIFTRLPTLRAALKQAGTLLPHPTHRPVSTQTTRPWVTVREAIGMFPPLDGSPFRNERLDFHYLHRVPVLDPKKYEWIRHTPSERGAFDNQCVAPDCGYTGNATHGSVRTVEGVNRASQATPLYCENCGSLLPRPYTIKNGTKVLMSGFTSAYRRMHWDLPAHTLTTNLSYPSSDTNVHPAQHRVLSLWEAIVLHSLDKYHYSWEFPDSTEVPDSLIRDSIGESVPPLGLERVVAHVLREAIAGGETTYSDSADTEVA